MPTQGQTNLFYAIARNEGYGPNGNLATRSNNPGNVANGNAAGLGVANEFNITIYPNVEQGIAASYKQLDKINEGKSKTFPKGPDTTLAEFSRTWTGNDPNALNNYMKMLGVTDPNTRIGDIMNGTVPTKTPTPPRFTTVDPPGQPWNGSSAASNASQSQPDIVRTPSDYKGVNGNDVDTNTFSQIQQSNLVVTDGLDEVAWYNDNNLITGNPRLRREVDPVAFQIQLHDTEDFVLTNQGKGGPLPIEIQLNASMKEYNIQMKHVYHNQRTRTGFHITLWGQQADVIEGSCTTGVFMNQFGLTDFFSTANVNDDLKRLVTSGYLFSDVPTDAFPSNDEDSQNQGVPNSAIIAAGGVTGGDVSVATVSGGNGDFDKVVQKYAPGNPAAAFRVAAQDAFVEFLSLFKNNGLVWYRTLGYENNIGEQRELTHIQAYSPKVGLSSSQIGARNNDVMTRGHVMMKFKNITYLGYFKTLNWTMDANNPFQWNFSFTFQVEKTLGFIFTPANG